MPIDMAALEQAGIAITGGEVEALLNDAIRRWLPPYPLPDARTGLPAATQAALLALGVTSADLAPLRPDEPRADLAAATDHAGLLASAWPVAEVAARLGVDPSRVRQRLAAHTLIGVRVDGGWRLPQFQFSNDGHAVVPGLATVTPLVVGFHPLDVATWFTTPQPDLVLAADDDEIAVSPRDWLLGGGDPQQLLPLIDDLRGYA